MRITSKDGIELARGLSNYSSKELISIIGHKSEDLSSILGYHGPEWVVSRENYALMRSGSIDGDDGVVETETDEDIPSAASYTSI